MFLVRISAQLLAIHNGNVYCIAVFWWEKLMVDRGEDGRLILERMFKKQDGEGGVDWIGLVNPLAPELFFLISAHPVYKI